MASEQTAPEPLKPRRFRGLDRWALPILLAAALILPVVLFGAVKGMKIAPTDIRKLLKKRDTQIFLALV